MHDLILLPLGISLLLYFGVLLIIFGIFTILLVISGNSVGNNCYQGWRFVDQHFPGVPCVYAAIMFSRQSRLVYIFLTNCTRISPIGVE